MSCKFCEIPNSSYLLENSMFYVIRDKNPVARGHVLLISKRHFESFFDITVQESIEYRDIILKARAYLDKHYAPQGYNIGINCGSQAGQSVFHFHAHIIPRYAGDRKKGGAQKAVKRLREYLEELL